ACDMVLVTVEAFKCMRRVSEAGKQKLSSPSVCLVFFPKPSVLPAGQAMGLPLASTPNGVAGMGFGPSQFSKCPISSENAVLYVCAAQITRVCGEEVEYIGWKSYGVLTQLVLGAGAYWTWPKPLAALAVMDPVWPVVRSWMTARIPWDVSPRDRLRLSPELMNRSLARSGVNVAVGEFTGFGVAVGRPSLGGDAKLTYSRPGLGAQGGFRTVPLTGSWAKLKIFIAAHHLVGSQALAPMATCHVGQGTHPGG